MDLFQRDETLGRQKCETLFRNCGVNDYSFTTGKYDKLDCYCNLYYNNSVFKVGIEIKNRKESDESFPTYMMEKEKFDYMDLQVKQGLIYSGWYFNFFGDSCYQFKYDIIRNLIDTNIISVKKVYCPSTTSEYSGWRLKDVYLIPKEYAYYTKI